MAEILLHINADNIEEIQKRLENLEKSASRIEKSINGMKFSGSATRGMSSLETQAVRVERAFRNAGQAISAIGGGLQGLGNAFGGKVVGTIKTMTTAFATMGLYGAAQGTVQRYDTMRIFPKQMALLGFSADQSAKAVNNLEQSVLGLPTGLDEIVESARQYITITGKLKKGTDIAIAANNALLAGGGDAQQRTWGQRQIRDLLAAGKLRSQEWESLIKALGPGLKDIGNAMGYKDFGKFRSELKENKIAAKDFINALIDVGTGQGVLAKRAELFKDTLSAAGKNIKNALQKLGAEGIDALDNVLRQKTGKGVVDNIVQISDGIKKSLIPALKGWISDNADGIIAFFDRLKNYDWAGLIGKVGSGLAKYYDVLTKFFSLFSPKFIGSMAVWAGPIGRVLQFAGGALAGVGKIAATVIRIFGKGRAIEAAADGAKHFTRLTTSLSGAFKGLALTAGITGEIALIGGVIYEYAKIVQAISKMDYGPNFKKNIQAVGDLGSYALILAGSLSTILGGLSTIPGFGAAATAGGILTGGLVALVGEIGLVIKEYVDILASVGRITLPSKNKISNIGSLLASLNDEVFDNVKKIPDSKVRSLENVNESVGYIKDIAEQLKAVVSVGSVGNISARMQNILDSVDVIFKRNFSKDDEREAKRAKNVLKPLSEAVSSVQSIGTMMAQLRESIKELFKNGTETRLVNLTKRVGMIMDSVDEILKPFRKGVDEYSDAAAQTKNISNAVANIGSAVTTLYNVREQLKKLVKKNDNGELYTKYPERIKVLVKGVLGAFDESQLELRTRERQRQMDNAKRVAETVTSVATIAGQLSDSYDKFKKLLPKEFLTGYMRGEVKHRSGKTRENSPIGRLAQRISTVITELNDAFKDIPDDIDASGDVAEKLGALKSNIDFIPQIVDKLKEVKGLKKDLKVPAKDGAQWDFGVRLKNLITGITTAFSETANADFTNLGSNAEQVYNAVGHLKKTCDRLIKIKGIIKENFKFDENGEWTLGKKLGSIMSGLTGAFTQANALTGEGGGTVGKLGTVAPYLEAIASQLEALAKHAKSAKGSLPQVQSGITGIGEAAKKFNGQFRELASNFGKMKSNIDGLGGKASAAALGVTILGASAGLAAGPMSRAASAAERLASAINSIPNNKTVNVSTTGNTGGGVGSFFKNLFGGHSYTGGQVHGPGGIDNVPMWLTNGEYVMRNKAVNAFGTHFMNRINAMDYEGALRALSIRAGAGMRHGGLVTNNYTRDNHANVTFNISRASQGYSQRRANRWARALS